MAGHSPTVQITANAATYSREGAALSKSSAGRGPCTDRIRSAAWIPRRPIRCGFDIGCGAPPVSPVNRSLGWIIRGNAARFPDGRRRNHQPGFRAGCARSPCRYSPYRRRERFVRVDETRSDATERVDGRSTLKPHGGDVHLDPCHETRLSEPSLPAQSAHSLTGQAGLVRLLLLWTRFDTLHGSRVKRRVGVGRGTAACARPPGRRIGPRISIESQS